IRGIERGQQPSGVGVRGEEAYHRHRIGVLACGACLTVGEQLRALRGGSERLGHGRQSHKSNDARTRFHAKAQSRKSGFVPSSASTDAILWLCWNPPMRISVKAQIRRTISNEHYRL